MEILTGIVYALYLVLKVYAAWAVGFMLLFALAAFLPKRNKKTGQGSTFKNMLVLIPAYKEDAVIVDSAREALNQDYPADRFTVAVIADSLQPETLRQLRQLPIEVVEVSFEKSTKSRALNAAMNQLGDDFEGVMILDADNQMLGNMLLRMNTHLQTGWEAIQGRRIPKNLDSTMALLDGISEEINNRIYCKGHAALGFSSKLSGSGMAFSYLLFKNMMKEVDAIGGFDKELELRFSQQGTRIYYDHEAKVKDEKVRSANVYSRQRRRWLSAQYHYLKTYWKAGWWQLISRGNLDFFNRVTQLALPPRLLMPGLLAAGCVLAWTLGADQVFWSALFAGNVVAYAISIPGYFWNMRLVKGLLYLPKALFFTCIAVLGLKNANKSFIHTPHGVPAEK